MRTLALPLVLALAACTQPEAVRDGAAPVAPPTARARPSPTPAPTPSRTPAVATIRYVAIGASDTLGVGASDPRSGSWPALLAARLPPSTFFNLGVSASLAAQARAEQLPDALVQKPTLVTIWLAVNDLNAMVEPQAYGETLGAIVDELLAGTPAAIFVGNVPDLRAVPVYARLDPALLLARVQAYNAAIAQVAAKDPSRVALVDLFTGSAELVSTATVAADGFHPSDAGYVLIADRFAAAMRARGIALR
ncbi:MAG: SGNH/GDSL hydrolase family protein [Thermoleophilaceae bacterium]